MIKNTISEIGSTFSKITAWSLKTRFSKRLIIITLKLIFVILHTFFLGLNQFDDMKNLVKLFINFLKNVETIQGGILIKKIR